MPEYVSTDEQRDVLASLEFCANSLQRTGESPAAWKWVVLSLHSALQGAMVCHLSGGYQVGALRKKNAEAWLTWLQGRDYDKPAPKKMFLASAPDLLKRLVGEAHRYEGDCGEVLEITDAQRESFKKLHALRNPFTHFPPRGWSIEIAYIREVGADALDLLELIASDPWPFRHLSDNEQERMDSTIAEIRRMLSES